jgi:C4-type Zn-finger protein
MIIFGTKASNIRNGQIINVDCPNCKSITTMKYSVFARYFHLYLIPIFPSKKLFVTECNSCQHTFGYVDVELIDISYYVHSAP